MDSPPETVPRSGTATSRKGQNPRPAGRGACQTYTFDTEPEVTVAAGADGTASVGWTPDSKGSHGVQVYATTRSGIQLSLYSYDFTVD